MASLRAPCETTANGALLPAREARWALRAVARMARGATPSTCYGSRRTVSFFGPCAPRTRMRSMSPVRLGPLMKEMKLG